MSLNLIDIEPMKPGWGRVWQSGIDEWWKHDQVPRPRASVSMVGPIEGLGLSAHISTYINDSPEDTLSKEMLLAMTDAVIGFLRNGVNVIIHCVEGKSRSSYLDCAVHMRAMNVSYDEALALIKKQHPIAQPNSGFEAQLRDLEPVLRNV